MAIDFTLTPEQRILQSGAQTFGREVLSKVNRVSAGIAKPDDRGFAT